MVRAQEYDASMMQEIYNQITAKCFQKCIGKPGDRLDKEEQKCLAKCIDRYLDSREVQARHPMARAAAPRLRARRRVVPLTSCCCPTDFLLLPRRTTPGGDQHDGRRGWAPIVRHVHLHWPSERWTLRPGRLA